MKPKEIQQFTTFDFVTLVIGLVAVAVISTPILKNGVIAQQRFGVQKEIESYARQLVHSAPTFLKSSRAPASLETASVKNDRWGQPYKWRVEKSESGKISHLILWSLGPNGQDESQAMPLQTSVSGTAWVNFQNDDLGVVVPIQ